MYYSILDRVLNNAKEATTNETKKLNKIDINEKWEKYIVINNVHK